jgi:hypothetical protein
MQFEREYGYVRHEATRQNVMLKGGSDVSLAMVTKGYKPREVNTYKKPSNLNDKSKLKCSHYGGTRHIKENYFELVGYPDWWKESKKKQATENTRGRVATAASTGSASVQQNMEPYQPVNRYSAEQTLGTVEPFLAENSGTAAAHQATSGVHTNAALTKQLVMPAVAGMISEKIKFGTGTGTLMSWSDHMNGNTYLLGFGMPKSR